MDIQSQQQIYALCTLAKICSDAPILQKHRRTMVDTAIRAASNIVTAESTVVYNSTASILQWGVWWSERALLLYNQLRSGKTHRQTTHSKINGKRPWTVEHQYPLNIIKHEIYNGADVEYIVDWMNTYGRAVIILHEENRLLLQSCKTLEEAHNRYANIVIVRHPHFDQQKEAG
jgi:hypothetical protein